MTVELERISKAFGSLTVLHELSLSVEHGEFMVLLGPSGCGKTTALRMIAGLESVTSGSIRIAGRDVTDVAPKNRDVAMVFQSYALYPHMTVAENIAYPLRIRSMDRAARAAAVERGPDAPAGGRTAGAGRAPACGGCRGVSGGGEPVSNLDAKRRASARGEIKRLQKRL